MVIIFAYFHTCELCVGCYSAALLELFSWC